MKQDDAIPAATAVAISLIRIQDNRAKNFRTKGSLMKSVTVSRCYLGGDRHETSKHAFDFLLGSQRTNKTRSQSNKESQVTGNVLTVSTRVEIRVLG